MNNEDTVENLLNLINKSFKFIADDNYNEAEKIINFILENNTCIKLLDVNIWQNIAEIYLSIGRFEKAKEAYIHANSSIGIAFSLIMLSSLDEAGFYLLKANSSPAKAWCGFLIDLFNQKNIIKSWPTFLQIRQFLEFTAYHLLLAGNYEYLNCLVLNLDELMQINMDSEKIIGAAYFHFGNLDEAINYFISAARKNQYDGEIYFNLAQIYLLKNKLLDALSMLTNASLLLPEHYPTKVLIEKTKVLLDKK